MRATIVKFGIGCLVCLWSFSVWASSDWLAPNHPDTYTVRKGDTLWDIAGRFLNDPWRWPEVWQASNIEDPHLIYPGDLITLSMDGDTPRLSVQRGSHQQQSYMKNGRKYVRLSPKIRQLPSQRAIPTIPISEIGPFLSQTKITAVGALNFADQISEVAEERILVSEGYRFYASGLSTQVGQALSIFKPGRILVHPETGEELGQEALYLGAAEVESAGLMSTLILRKGIEEIRAGDKLLPVEEDRVEPYYFPKLPQNEAQGFILTVMGGVNQIGRNQVVVISGGSDLNREEGDVLAVYQKKTDLPSRVKAQEDHEKRLNKDAVQYYQFAPQKVGKVIVFKVFDKTSLSLVMDAVRPINLRDEVRRP